MKYPAYFLALSLLFTSCIRTGVFEKNITFPDHTWRSGEKATIRFNISDTTSNYRAFFVIRHTDAYRYNNIWIKVTSRIPGDSTVYVQRFDLPLSTQNKWNGTGMDDVFEQRIGLSRQALPVQRPGIYEFTVEHLMREDPLREVLNAGIRLEKTMLP